MGNKGVLQGKWAPRGYRGDTEGVRSGYRGGTEWVPRGYHRESGYLGCTERVPRGHQGGTEGVLSGYMGYAGYAWYTRKHLQHVHEGVVLRVEFKLGSGNFLQRHGFMKVWIGERGWGHGGSTLDLDFEDTNMVIF